MRCKQLTVSTSGYHGNKNRWFLSLKDKQRHKELSKYENRNQHQNFHKHAKNERNPFITLTDMNV